MKKLNVGFSYILILLMLGFLTGCSSMFQGRTQVSIFSDDTGRETIIVEGTKANVKGKTKAGSEYGVDQTGKSLSEKLQGILPPVNIDK